MPGSWLVGVILDQSFASKIERIAGATTLAKVESAEPASASTDRISRTSPVAALIRRNDRRSFPLTIRFVPVRMARAFVLLFASLISCRLPVPANQASARETGTIRTEIGRAHV